jgi:putative transposon-encoded protein
MYVVEDVQHLPGGLRRDPSLGARGLHATTHIKISIYILLLLGFAVPRRVEVVEGSFVLSDEVEVVFEKVVTPFGTSGKLDVPKRYIGRRAYVIVLKE